MPRPVRRPKRVVKSPTPQRETFSSQPSSPPPAAAAAAAAHKIGRAHGARLTEVLETPSPERIVAPVSLSDDEFGFHEVQHVRPLLKRPDRTDKSPAARAPIYADPIDSHDEDLTSPRASPTLAPISNPNDRARPMRNEATKSMKTSDLQNLLPHARKHARQGTRTRITIGTNSRISDSDSESSGPDETRYRRRARSTSRRGTLKSTTSKPTTTKKTTTTTKMNRSRRSYKSTDAARRSRREEGEESDEAPVTHQYTDTGISEQDRKKLDEIRAKFEDLKEWQMEVETVSSPFYSS